MKSPFITAVVGLLVVAGACADSTSADAPATTAPTETAEPTPDTEAPPETIAPTPTATHPTAPPTTPPTKPTVPAPTPTTPPETTPSPAPSNGARCLIGSWVISDAELDAYFDVVAVNAAFESIDNDGVIRLTFTETGFEWTNQYSLAMRVDGTGYESTSSGSFAGSYTEAGGVIAGSVERDDRGGSLTHDGQPVGDVGDLFVGINLARPMDSLAFSCDGPVLVLDAGPSAGARHTVRLTPA
ncbi:MAG: hypothetical protein R8G01_01225 [Ilumatobacteraceae bacterium]|nr:hypothetical protein [Ilumatobacteraceae bacterium]